MSTRRALAFSFLDRYAALVLSIVSSMFIARLLTPSELGVFSVTMVLTMFISSLRDMGAGQYLVQEKDLNQARIQAAWTVLLGMGALMSGVTLSAAYPVAWFYGDDQMTGIMGVISLNFLISPFGSMTYAWLMREMRFQELAVMRFCASLTGACVSVGLAWKDYGPISLALGNLAATIVNAGVALYFRPSQFGWRPGLRDLRRVIGFGSKISLTSLAYNLASGTPEILLGRLQSFAAAGFYSRANGLAMMFQRLVLDATQSIALPLFAKAGREQGDFREPFVRATAYVTVLGWPFLAGLGLLAHPVILLLYGPQWGPAVEVTQCMLLGIAVGLPAAMCPHALLAAGRSDLYMKASLFAVGAHIVLVGFGACQSLMGAALGFVLAQTVAMPVWMLVTTRELKLDVNEISRALVRSMGVASLTAIAPVVAVLLFGSRPTHGVLTIFATASMAAVGFGLASKWLAHPIFTELTRVVQWGRSWMRR